MQYPLSFILGFVCFVQGVFAQPDEPYPFAHYNFNNGLAAYNSNSIIQDKQGYMWISTINGLQRFDGHRFITFRHNPDDKSSLSDNYIDHFMYDSRGNLWLVLGNGEIGIFDTKRFTFRRVDCKVNDNRILKLPRKLMEDSDGNLLYIFYGHEVTTYNSIRSEFSPSYNTLRVPNNWKVTSLTEDTVNKRYWIGTDSGLCVFNKQTKSLSYRGHNRENILFINQFGADQKINGLLIDNQSRFWYTTWPSESVVPLMNCYDLKSEKLILDRQAMAGTKKYYEIKKILQQKDGRIWIAGLNVLMRFNDETRKFQPVYESQSAKGIDYREVNNIFEDREKNIWVSTDNNGLYIFRPSTQLFTSVKHTNYSNTTLDEGSVIHISYNNRSQILAAVWSDGIHKYNRNLEIIPPTEVEKAPNSFWSICRLSNKRTFWMGLQSGIMIYDDITGNAKYYNPSLFEDKLVRSIAEDKIGNIWLAVPSAGLFKWNSVLGKNNFDAGFYKIKNTPASLIEKVTVDSKGFVWVCTLMNGVYKINPVSDSILQHFTTQGPPSKRLMADAVTDAFEYNDSIMIFLTGSLNIYNNRIDSIFPISSADGMPSNIVRSIEKDNKNYLWLGLFNGLCRMNFEKKAFTYYDRNDGMINDNFNYSSSCHLPDGRLAFGTTSDFVLFNPNDLTGNSIPPEVVITDISVLNRSVSVDSLQQVPKISFDYDQNFITFGFSGLSYYNVKWSYYYMLDGLEKEWKRAGDLNQVNYSFLPPGTYTFKVKAENADGVSGKNITELQFTIEPPFWKSWWFYSFLVLMSAIILYLIDKERMRRKEAMEKMRSDIADNLHTEVNTALNKINILSEMARIKSQKDPLRSAEYFSQSHQKSHDMIIAMDDMLWSINPENDSMIKTVERIREYIDALKRHHAVEIDLLVDKSVASLEMNMKLRHDLFIMMKDGIRSVVQAGTKTCKIHIGYQKDILMYTIEIENKNCDLQQINNQLQQADLEKRLQSMNATLTSNMHLYTSIFELSVPIR